jgi:hypothetical protein
MGEPGLAGIEATGFAFNFERPKNRDLSYTGTKGNRRSERTAQGGS